ncbi:MAG: YceI family protein [Gemmatimonadaceae bacterium]|nr:YceI family protein [Gemmatimonadaceae bacterium]
MTTWTIDPTHTNVGFAVKHLMISTVRGRFASFTGTISLDEQNPANSRVTASIDAGSIDTRAEQRDAHLRSADFFDADNHPTLDFVSTRVEGNVNGDFRIVGNLTIRGVTREIVLDAKFDGAIKDPWGNDRKAFSATGKINREAYGLVWNQILETGGLTVGNDVKIEIESEFVKAA